MAIQHSAPTATYTVTVAGKAHRVTYDPSEAGAKREAYQFALELEAELVAKAAAADVAAANLAIAHAVSGTRGYEPDAADLAEAAAFLADVLAEEDAALVAPRRLPARPVAVIATSPATDPALVDEALSRQQRQAERERDQAQARGDAAAARLGRERHDAIARARHYLAQAVQAGRTLVTQLPAGDWQVAGSRGTPYTLVLGDDRTIQCSCDHGTRLRSGRAPRGVCWHTVLVGAVEEACDLAFDLAA